jgi:hypothetical protein
MFSYDLFNAYVNYFDLKSTKNWVAWLVKYMYLYLSYAHFNCKSFKLFLWGLSLIKISPKSQELRILKGFGIECRLAVKRISTFLVSRVKVRSPAIWAFYVQYSGTWQAKGVTGVQILTLSMRFLTTFLNFSKLISSHSTGRKYL